MTERTTNPAKNHLYRTKKDMKSSKNIRKRGKKDKNWQNCVKVTREERVGGEGKNAAADDSSHKLGYFQFFEMELRDGKNASHFYTPSLPLRKCKILRLGIN